MNDSQQAAEAATEIGADDCGAPGEGAGVFLAPLVLIVAIVAATLVLWRP